MDQKSVLEAVKNAREGAGKRNFKQSFDLALTLKDLDLNKPEHKVKAEVILPHGRGKPVTIGAIAGENMAENAKKEGIELIIDKSELQKLAKNKREAKKLVRKVDFFIAQPDLMIDVGKTLGPILGPRNKMPQPVPPQGDLKPILARLGKLIKLRVQNQPVLHCIVGSEEQSDEEITANVMSVINTLSRELPKGEKNIRSTHVKKTMGKSFKVGESE